MIEKDNLVIQRDSLLKELRIIKDKISKIDAEKDKDKCNRAIGRCYILSDYYGSHYRAERFVDGTVEMLGTIVYVGKNKNVSIDVGYPIFVHDLDQCRQISKSQFKKYLTKAKSQIKI